jgi:hypothetical protein
VRLGYGGVLTIWPAFVALGFAVVLSLLAGLLIKRMTLFRLTSWVKIVGMIGLIVTSVTTTIKLLTCFLPNGVVQADVATNRPFWPEMPKSLHYYSNAVAKLNSGGFQNAHVFVFHASLGARIWLATQALATGVLFVSIFIAVRQVAIATERGASFREVSGPWLRRTAWIVIISGEVAAIAATVGNALVATDLSGTGFGWEAEKTIPNPFTYELNGITNQVFGYLGLNQGMGFQLELWPIFVGLGLYLLAKIVDAGKQLQEDTDGLV